MKQMPVPVHNSIITNKLSSSPRPRLPPRVLERCGLLPNISTIQVQLPHHLESSRPLTHALPHDDALAHPFNHVPLHVPRSLEQVIGRLLKTGKLQYTVSHLGQPKPCYAQHFAFVRHHVSKELHVPRVNVHAAHHEAYFIDDGLSCRFNAEHVTHFHDGVRLSGKSIQPWSRHTVAETITLDQQCVLALVVSLDDGAGSFRVTANGDIGEDTLDRLHT